MIRTPFQRHLALLLRQMTPAERHRYRTYRTFGLDWAEAITWGVTLPAAASALAAFQAGHPAD